ncbi:hypothetical protein Tco_0870321 [Tanacetum coccineum]
MKQRSRRPKRKDTQVPQSSVPSDDVADEVVNKEMDDSLERAATTATSLNAEQNRGGRPRIMRDTIAQTRSENVSKFSNDPLLSRAKVESSGDEEGLGEEDVSKHGMIADIDADAGINLVSTHFDADTNMFGVHDLVGDEVVVEEKLLLILRKQEVLLEKILVMLQQQLVLLVKLVTTADELTLAQALTELKSARPPTQGISFREPKPMVEKEKPMKKQEQMRIDEELAFKLQAKEEEEERLAREKAQKIKEVNIAWDDIQAKVKADYQLAQRLSKRAGDELEQENAKKKQKVVEDKETTNLQKFNGSHSVVEVLCYAAANVSAVL